MFLESIAIWIWKAVNFIFNMFVVVVKIFVEVIIDIIEMVIDIISN